ncbi:response regulator transcription factor [Xanthomonas maliensis]|uniref:response regulator transcription factor n=1 Tax=Xanthomonas maliensis TaxID=1321368 RepID=UPI0003A0163D|nr:response regulator transcription factor [Xanthomonas maliensis]KAB7770825.1 DNA-binding response regulator [Xanthomonas maliensis]
MYADVPHETAMVLTRDARLASQINASLASLACRVGVYSDELELLRCLRHSTCDILIFDASCVTASESSLLAWQRCHCGHPTPLIVLGRFDCADAIMAWYAAGASDVISLPFNAHELHVRTSMAMTPRMPTAVDASQIVALGPYRLVREENTVYLHDEPIVLTAREFSIAWLLFSNPSTCFRRCQLAKAVWGSHTEFTDRTIEQHIYKLRKKLQLSNQDGPVRIRTVYSHGYKLELANPDAVAPAHPRTMAFG